MEIYGGTDGDKGICGYIWGVRAIPLAIQSASEMTFIVSGGALNSTHSLTLAIQI